MFKIEISDKGMWELYMESDYVVNNHYYKHVLCCKNIKICEFHSKETAKEVKEKLEQYLSKISFKKDIKNKILQNDDLIKLYKTIWQSKDVFHDRKEEEEKRLKDHKKSIKKLEKRKDLLLIQESNLKNQNKLLLEKIDKEKSRLYQIERRIIND
jgi:hypothetical protein